MTQQITPTIVRGARAMLDWTRLDLALFADVAEKAIQLYEHGSSAPRAETLAKLSAALDRAGCRTSVDPHGVPIVAVVPGVAPKSPSKMLKTG